MDLLISFSPLAWRQDLVAHWHQQKPEHENHQVIPPRWQVSFFLLSSLSEVTQGQLLDLSSVSWISLSIYCRCNTGHWWPLGIKKYNFEKFLNCTRLSFYPKLTSLPAGRQFVLWSDGLMVSGETKERTHCYQREEFQPNVEFSQPHFIRMSEQGFNWQHQCFVTTWTRLYRKAPGLFYESL